MLLEYFLCLFDYFGCEIFIKCDDMMLLVMGGNKLCKLEFFVVDVLCEGVDILIIVGVIQFNYVCQMVVVVVKLGLYCVVLLENFIGIRVENYLSNGNCLLLDFFNIQVEMCDVLIDFVIQFDELVICIEVQGYCLYVILVGGFNVFGVLGYVESVLEISQQCEDVVVILLVVVVFGSVGIYVGLVVGFEQLMLQVELIGVIVLCLVVDQLLKVVVLQQVVVNSFELQVKVEIILWDDYFVSGYGMLNEDGMVVVKLLVQLEGILFDLVYIGKVMVGFIDGIMQKCFKDEGLILFVYIGGVLVLFVYYFYF